MKVTCELCGKEFDICPSRIKNRSHSCSKECRSKLSSIKYSKKITKQCEVCGKDIELKLSRINRQKHFTCSKICRSLLIKDIYKGSQNPNFKYSSEIESLLSERFSTLQRRALQKGLEFDLTYDFLLELYNKQEGLCYYTNLEMRTDRKRDYNTLSVDRIDSNKGYTRDNIVFCMLCINTFKSDHSIEDINMVFQQIEAINSIPINVQIKKIYEDSELPYQKHKSDAGHDLFVHHIEEFDNYLKVYTGVSVCPPVNYYFELFPRSSIYKQGLTLYNSIGVIDNEYRGEIIAIFKKTKDFKELPKVGERIAQIILRKQINIKLEEVKELNTTLRNDGGFGSTNEK